MQLSVSGLKISAKSAIVTIALTVAAGLIVEWMKDFPVLRFIDRSMGLTWDWLNARTSISNWLLGLLTLAALACAALVARGVVKRKRRPLRPSYRSDTFDGIEWYWSYAHDQIDQSSIIGICPRCQLELQVFENTRPSLDLRIFVKCFDCGYKRYFPLSPDELRLKVTRYAERSIRKEIGRVARS